CDKPPRNQFSCQLLRGALSCREHNEKQRDPATVHSAPPRSPSGARLLAGIQRVHEASNHGQTFESARTRLRAAHAAQRTGFQRNVRLAHVLQPRPRSKRYDPGTACPGIWANSAASMSIPRTWDDQHSVLLVSLRLKQDPETRMSPKPPSSSSTAP